MMPPRHPLFRKLPPKDVVLDIFGKLGLHVGHVFTRDNIDMYVALSAIDVLKPYYYDCKSADLFANIDEKRLITILRQCLKVHGYTLKGRETTRNGQKVVNYTVSKDDDSVLEHPIVISFD